MRNRPFAHVSGVIVALALLLSACNVGQATEVALRQESGESQILFVAPELKDCVGVSPMQCMQTADSEAGPWSLFYSQIDGFIFEPGFLYELRVRSEQVANPPADSSSIRYILEEIVSKTEVEATPPAADGLAGSSWTLSEISMNQDGMLTPPVGERPVTIEFQEGRAAGNATCNRFTGGYTANDSALSFGPAASTRMLCPGDDLNAQEFAFFQVLQLTSNYTIEGDTLTLLSTEGVTLASFVRG
jgi:heat shock protein HslJ